MGIKILKTSRYVPPRVVENSDFEKIIETSDEWIRERTGIERRHFVEVEDTSDLALKAVEAFRNEDLSNVDAVIVATFTPDFITPSIASIIQRDLGIKEDVMAFDFNMACSGFVAGLRLAESLIGVGRRAIVVGAEVISKVMDLKDRRTAILFGDGAGAVLLEKTAAKSHFDVGSRGDFDNLHALGRTSNPNADRALYMEGKEVFRFATDIMVKTIERTLEKAEMSFGEIDHFVCHQANSRIISHVQRKLKLEPEKFFMNLQNYGNTSAASIPIALDEMNEKGLLKEGQKVVLAGFGGGLSWASTVIEW